MGPGITVIQVVAIVGGHQRQGQLGGEVPKRPVDDLLLGQLVGHDFQKEPLPVEYGGQFPGDPPGLIDPTGVNPVGNVAFQTGGKGDQPGIVSPQAFEIHPGVVVKALQMAEGHQPAEVAVALSVLSQQNQVVGVGEPLRRRGPFLASPGGDIQFAADDGLDAGLGPFAVEFHRAEKVAVIRDGQRLEAQPPGLLEQLRDPDGPVEQAVFGVKVQVCERRRSGQDHLMGQGKPLGWGTGVRG